MPTGDIDDHIEVALAVDEISERTGEEFGAHGVEIADDGDFDGAQLAADHE
jgi:hypothetical protein